MDFNATIDLIIRDLDDAREIIDDLKRYPGVPTLQVELAKSKCKSAGEVIALLKNRQIFMPDIENNKQLIVEPDKKEITVKKEIPEKEIPEKENIVNLKSDESRKSPVLKKMLSDQPEKKSSELIIIADTFSHLSNSLNEQLGNRKGDEGVSALLKTKQLSSLSEAIGVNDRFLYIREIFNGNKEAYSQAIFRLDSAECITDARAVIMSYTDEKNENEAVEQLLDLVKRKFPLNE